MQEHVLNEYAKHDTHFKAIKMGEYYPGTHQYYQVITALQVYVGTQYLRGVAVPEVGWSYDKSTGLFYLATMGTEVPLDENTYLIVDDGNVRTMPKWRMDKYYTRLTPVEISAETPQQPQLGPNHLETMLEMQRDVERAWGRLPDPADREAISRYVREVILCATDELHEVLAEVHWKPWKTPSGIKDMPAYREELADVMHFILDLYLAAGLSGEDIYQDYMAKHNKNMDRTKSKEYKES